MSELIQTEKKRIESLLQSDEIKTISSQFAYHNKQLFIVGGAIRDCILDNECHDYDFCTDATPDEIKSIISTIGKSIYCIGEKFGTIGLIFKNQKKDLPILNCEFTTFRKDTYENQSRNPSIEYSTLEEDLARRDFTINSLACSLCAADYGRIVDNYRGIYDIRERIIRAVGTSDDRILEDPLRILRAIRFSVLLNFEIDPLFEVSIKKLYKRMRILSNERIKDEFVKMIRSETPSIAIRKMIDYNISEYVVPEINDMLDVEQPLEYHTKNVFEHTMSVLDQVENQEDLRLAALYHDVGKPATQTISEDGIIHFIGHESVSCDIARASMTNLRFPNHMITRVCFLVKHHMDFLGYNISVRKITDAAIRRLILKTTYIVANEEIINTEYLLKLVRADITSSNSQKVRFRLEYLNEFEKKLKDLREKENVTKLKSPLDGNELMKMFDLQEGIWIGKVKDYLVEQIIEGNLKEEDYEKASSLSIKYVNDNYSYLL